MTEPKTENSVREICLSDEAIRLLVKDRKDRSFSPYMFPFPKNRGMYGPGCVGRFHKKLLEKAGSEEHIRFHDLRLTFSALVIRSGIDLKIVEEIFVHASTEFSLDVRTHVTAGMKKEVAPKQQLHGECRVMAKEEQKSARRLPELLWRAAFSSFRGFMLRKAHLGYVWVKRKMCRIIHRKRSERKKSG